MQAILEAVIRAVRGARRAVVVTGAGMSQESGVPTFRDAQSGLWSRFDPSELATEAAFRSHPARVFGWYLWRWRLARRAQPHRGYHALVRLEGVFDDLLVVTQNVDGLHRRAGTTSVVELHGSLDAFRCIDRGHPFDGAALDALAIAVGGEVDPPACRSCGSLVRPGIVWFGEALPLAAIEQAWAAMDACDVMLVVGTSALVYPAAGLAWTAIERGRVVIEINPEPTPLSHRVAVSWRVRAGAGLSMLAERLLESHSSI